jgi:serine/threonine protein phosphatase PrpC
MASEAVAKGLPMPRRSWHAASTQKTEGSMEVEIATLAQQGGRRYNEDVHGQWQDERYLACLIADGAGGHGGGDVAAAVARASVLDGFAEAPVMDAGGLRSLLDAANRAVVARQAEGGTLAAMRSTVVLAAIDLQRHHVAWAHTGDSRAYLFRDGALLTRTVDHSLVQQLVAFGTIDEAEARHHPQRNMLLSALGSLDEPPTLTVSAPMALEPDDVMLLCSDGVWEPLGDEVLLALLLGSRSASHWIEQIDQRIRATAPPGHDNYTAIALWLRKEGDTTVMLDDDEAPAAG